MAKTKKRLAVDVEPEKHARFKAEAEAAGVSIMALMEHKLFGTPLTDRPVGRPEMNQDERLPLPHAS